MTVPKPIPRKALALAAALVLLLGAALWANARRHRHPPAITQLLTLIYNAPDQAILDLQEQNPDPLEEIAAREALFQERYGPLMGPQLNLGIFYQQVEAYHRLALRYDGTTQLKAIQLKEAGEGDYRYTVTLLCTNSQGTRTTMDLAGSVQLDGNGLIRVFRPHGHRTLVELLSGKPWPIAAQP